MKYKASFRDVEGNRHELVSSDLLQLMQQVSETALQGYTCALIFECVNDRIMVSYIPDGSVTSLGYIFTN
jgi:hypothetical protein